MKKVFLGLVAFILLSLALSSCKKHEEHEGTITYQTVEIVLDMNKSYQYSFGTIKNKAIITKQANSFLVSELDKVSEAVLFNYTPKNNFTGTDEVQVTIGEEEHEHHHKQGPHLLIL